MTISQSPGWATLTSSTDSGAMQAANSAALTAAIASAKRVSRKAAAISNGLLPVTAANPPASAAPLTSMIE